MRPQPSSEQLKRVAASSYAGEFLGFLEDAKSYVADARNGEWTTEARKAAIEAIDAACVAPMLKAAPKEGKTATADDYSGMI